MDGKQIFKYEARRCFFELKFSEGSQEIGLDVPKEGVIVGEGWHIFPNPHPPMVRILMPNYIVAL